MWEAGRFEELLLRSEIQAQVHMDDRRHQRSGGAAKLRAGRARTLAYAGLIGRQLLLYHLILLHFLQMINDIGLSYCFHRVLVQMWLMRSKICSIQLMT